VVFDTYEFAGPIDRVITVASNDPTSPNLELRLTGRIVRREAFQKAVGEYLNEVYVLLDVRDPAAYAAGHLAGAMNVPAGQAGSYAATLPPSALYFCYDQDGTTAGSAVTALRAGGLAAVYAVAGGVSSWGQRRPWASLLVAGQDASWGRFLDVSGARANYSSSTTGARDISSVDYFVTIDLRSAAAYAAGHLAGALSMPEASASAYVSGLPTDVPVLIYSDDGVTSDRLAETLSRGHGLVASLLGGLVEWQKQHGNFLIVSSAG